MLFVSVKNKNGQYESIFNQYTSFDNMLISYKMKAFLVNHSMLNVELALIISRILLEKLYPTNFNANIHLLLKENKQLLGRLSAFIERGMEDFPSDYPPKTHFESLPFSHKDLEDGSLDKYNHLPF